MKAILIGCGKAGQELLLELVLNPEVLHIDIFDPQALNKNRPLFASEKIRYLTEIAPNSFIYDFSVIASPDETHAKYILISLKNNVHCFVEKPIVTNRKDLTTVMQTLETRPDVLLSTNFILRAAPLFIRLKELISIKAFGSKVYIEGKYLYGRWEKIADGWRGNAEHDYSVILGGLIHLVDLSCYLTGNFDFQVEQQRMRLTNKEPEHIYDFGSIRMTSNKVGICNLSTTFSSPVSHRRDISIYGDLGWVEIIGQTVKTGGALAGIGLETLRASSGSKGLLLKEFIELIQKRQISMRQSPTIEEVVRVHRLLIES